MARERANRRSRARAQESRGGATRNAKCLKEPRKGCQRRQTHRVNFLEILIAKYDLLVDAVRLPRMDREVYEAVFMAKLRKFIASSGNRLISQKVLRKDARMAPLVGGLELVLEGLKEHREKAMNAMRLIEHREEVVQRLIACSKFYDEGQCTINDAQLSFLILLQEHQMTTVLVIDAIKRWQETIYTPEPFTLWNGQFYTDRILEDCEGISKCDIGRSLSLYMKAYPCNSNMDLQRTTHRKDLMRRSKVISTRSVMERGLEPVFCPELVEHLEHQQQAGQAATAHHYGAPSQWKRQNRRKEGGGAAAADVKKKQSRLADAEEFILSESENLGKSLEAQVKLAEEMELFIPFLRIPLLFVETAVAKGCVPLDSSMWPEMLNKNYCANYAVGGETLEELPGPPDGEDDDTAERKEEEEEETNHSVPKPLQAMEGAERRTPSPHTTVSASSSRRSSGEKRSHSSSSGKRSDSREKSSRSSSRHAESEAKKQHHRSPPSSRASSSSSKAKSSRSSSQHSTKSEEKKAVDSVASSRSASAKKSTPASSMKASSHRSRSSSKAKSSRSSSQHSTKSEEKKAVDSAASSRSASAKKSTPASSMKASSHRSRSSSKAKSCRSSSQHSTKSEEKKAVDSAASSRSASAKKSTPASSMKASSHRSRSSSKAKSSRSSSQHSTKSEEKKAADSASSSSKRRDSPPSGRSAEKEKPEEDNYDDSDFSDFED